MNLQTAIKNNLLYDKVLHHHRTGSSYTVDPPVLDTDIDFLVFVSKDGAWRFINALIQDGWKECSSVTAEGAELYNQDPEYSNTWYSVRRGPFNLIVAWDWDWYARAIAATELCRVLNLKEKQHRCNTFRVIRDLSDEHNIPEPAWESSPTSFSTST